MRSLMIGLFVLAVIGAVFALIWMGDQSAQLEREHARQIEALEAEARVSEGKAAELSAQADADLASAELERAQGQRSREEAMGRAIEAPAIAAARAVDAQTEVVLEMGQTNQMMMRSIPFGLLVGIGIALGGAFCAGIAATALVSGWVREQQRWRDKAGEMENA